MTTNTERDALLIATTLTGELRSLGLFNFAVMADTIRAALAAPVAGTGEPALWVNPGDLANPNFIGVNAAKAGHEQKGKHYTLPLYTTPPAAAAGREDGTVERVAKHMAMAIEFIEKQYPGARQLDAGPIMRNLRRWRDQLDATTKEHTDD